MFDELILSINSNIKAQETDSRKICLRASFKSNRTQGTSGAGGQRGGVEAGFGSSSAWDSASAGRASGAQAGAGAAGLGDAAARVGGK